MSDHGSIRLARLGPPVTEIVLHGEIDCAVSPSALEFIDEVRGAAAPVRFNAHHLRFIDASGLRAITQVGNCSGHKPVLSSPPPVLLFLLEVTQMDQMFTIDTETAGDAETAEEPPIRA